MDFVDPVVRAAPGLQERLVLLWEQTGDESLRRVGEGHGGDGSDIHSEQELSDWISTCLMNCYKNTGDPQVFALLFDLNQTSFMQAIHAKIRRSSLGVDAHDVLQEVFLNIYRYPHRFLAEKADSFRNWGHRIVRNTLFKFLRGESRLARFATLDEDLGQREDARERTPYRSATDAESAGLVDCAYLIYLNLYLSQFERLSFKEQRALTMVEVEGLSYKQAAEALGIRLENLKMVIFRGRRKIFRGLSKTLEDLADRSAAGAESFEADVAALGAAPAPAGSNPASNPAGNPAGARSPSADPSAAGSAARACSGSHSSGSHSSITPSSTPSSAAARPAGAASSATLPHARTTLRGGVLVPLRGTAASSIDTLTTQ